MKNINTALVIALVFSGCRFCIAQDLLSREGNIIVCTVEIEHASADHLAKTLYPLLSPEGRLVPDQRTNTLIIKDRESVVNMLSKIIKGKPCTRDDSTPDEP
jgi:type II secretory pathway component GspD/PulD (secretin)